MARHKRQVKTQATAEPVAAEPVQPKAPDTKRQIITRAVVRCEHCGARDSFRQTRGVRDYQAFSQAPARCVICGLSARIRIVH